MRQTRRRLPLALSLLSFAIAACSEGGQVERLYGDTVPADTGLVVFGDVTSDTSVGPDSAEPEDTVVAPEDTVVAPEDTAVPPEDTDVAPGDTVAPPEDTAAPPEDTVAPPEDTDVAPEDTVVAPEDTVAPPEDTDVAPEDTTEPQDTTPADTTQPPLDPLTGSYDVIVVGAGTGGVSAAIAAARRGASVALLEETDWVGGQMTAAGVTSMDEGGVNKASGIYADFVARVRAHYQALGHPIGTCYWSPASTCFEPRVGRLILAQMVLEQPNIHALLRTRVTQVDSGSVGGHTRVTGVHGVQRRTGAQDQPWILSAAIVIDATETGDVLALGPAPYRLGRHASGALDASDCLQDLTWTAVIKRYPGGAPAALRVTTAPPGYDSAVAAHFAAIVAAGGADWLTGAHTYPVSWDTHTGYRGMPDSSGAAYTSATPWLITRTGVNWANDAPLTVGDLTASDRGRSAFCDARLRTLRFIYYLQSTLGHDDWSVADDEGYDGDYNTLDNPCPQIPASYDAIVRHLPVMPYLREGRRLVGVTTVTAGQIYRASHCDGCPKRAATNFPDAVAIGDYAVDLHACNAAGDLEAGLETTADVPPTWTTGAFQVPMGALIPASVDGLLAAEKNLSVSRLVNGATRLQPITMLTGQAAGTLAALSIARGEQPRDVPSLLVQEALLERGCRLALQSYADLPRTDPAWKDAQLLAARGVMVGYDDVTFAPDDDLTREQAAALIVRTFDLTVPPPPATPTFSDVDPSGWAYAYVEALYSAGLTAGCATDPPRYCPEFPLKRGELATFLVRGSGLDPATAPSTPYYTDVSSAAAHWSFPFIQLAAEHDLMGGCGGGWFCPEDDVSRRDAAAAVHRTLRARVDQ